MSLHGFDSQWFARLSMYSVAETSGRSGVYCRAYINHRKNLVDAGVTPNTFSLMVFKSKGRSGHCNGVFLAMVNSNACDGLHEPSIENSARQLAYVVYRLPLCRTVCHFRLSVRLFLSLLM